MIRLVIPKGSLERATMELFAAADLRVWRGSDVDYRATIDDPRISEVRVMRPQEIPRYVAEGLFDMGITGRDWIDETGAVVDSLGELNYSKNTNQPISVVLAVAKDGPIKSVADLSSGIRIATEYPSLTQKYFETLGIDAEISLSYGATEAKVPEIADAVVEITETGRALRAAGLCVIDTLLVSRTELIANPDARADPMLGHEMAQIHSLLAGTLRARDNVLVKLNVTANALDGVLAILPAMKVPTVSELSQHAGYAVEAVVPRHTINTLLPSLIDAGATDILEIPLTKIVP